MKNDHEDGKDRPSSFESPKIVVTHHPVEGQRMRIEQPAGSDNTETLAGHTAKVFYNYVEEHLPFPELPNFGVLHLSVPKAAALIAEDLIRSGRNGVVERKEGSVPGRERSLLELITQFQARLLHSIDRGTLRYAAGARDLADLLEPGPSDFIPERTYIHYNDLVKWLIAQGYVDHAGRSDAGPALLEYEQDELELAEKIELDVKTRRAMQLRLKPPKTRWDEVYPPLPEPDDRIAIQEALSQALARVGELENNLRELKALGTNREDLPLTPRGRKSHHILIAGLCDALGMKLQSHNATSSACEKLEAAGLKLDKKTIKLILDDSKVYSTPKQPVQKKRM